MTDIIGTSGSHGLTTRTRRKYVKSGVAELGRRLGVSRQRAWQILKNSQGLCQICGSSPSIRQGVCPSHLADKRRFKRESQRKRNGYKPWRKGGVGRPPIGAGL